MNLAILVLGTVLAIVAASPHRPLAWRRGATIGLFVVMLVAPFFSTTTSVLFDALTAMCVAYGFVSTHESSQRDALRSRERRVPGGTVLHGANRLTSCIDVFARCLMANELFFG